MDSNSFNLLYFDIYSKRISFFYNKKEKISSIFGFILTITYILVSVILFIYYFIIIISKKELKVYDSTIYSKETPLLNANSTHIYFAFGIENSSTSIRFIDETIYYPQILYIDRVKRNGEFYTAYKEELPYERCDQENFGENYQKFFSKGELNTSYCLKQFNVTLAGGYKYDKMSYIRLKIFPCVNKTENHNHCKPREVINKYISGSYLSLLIKDIGLNPINYSNPITPTVQDLYTTIDKQIFRDFILYYGLTEIQSDIGIFGESIKREQYLRYRKHSQSFYFREKEEIESDKEICVIQIRLDDSIDIQKRSYTKISEIFSRIGGYMQFLSTVFSILSIIANTIGPEIKILNGIFNFNIKNNKMIIKVGSLRDFTIKNFSFKSKELIYFPKRKYKRSTKGLNENNNLNNMSYKCFIDANKNEKVPPITIINNKHDETRLNINHDKIHKTDIPKLKISLVKEKKKVNKDIYSLMSPQSKISYYIKDTSKNKNLEVTSIHFNFFEYYCLRKLSTTKKEIELFKRGSTLYRKRMDIINVFTLLLLTEKKLLNIESENKDEDLDNNSNYFK
jgi:hypothetical protein